MSEPLKLCPFCGSVARLCGSSIINAYFVACDDCDLYMQDRKTQQEAIDLWNTRAPIMPFVPAAIVVVDPGRPAADIHCFEHEGDAWNWRKHDSDCGGDLVSVESWTWHKKGTS